MKLVWKFAVAAAFFVGGMWLGAVAAHVGAEPLSSLWWLIVGVTPIPYVVGALLLYRPSKPTTQAEG